MQKSELYQRNQHANSCSQSNFLLICYISSNISHLCNYLHTNLSRSDPKTKQGEVYRKPAHKLPTELQAEHTKLQDVDQNA